MSDVDIFAAIELQELTCCSCGIRFGMLKSLYERRQNDYQSLWCPNGHRQSFTRPPLTRDQELVSAREKAALAREETEALRDKLAVAEAHIDQLRETKRPLFRLPRRSS